MRILQVITSLKIGGAEHIVVLLAKLLRQRGHEVDVVVFNGEETSFTRELDENGCKIFSLGTGYYNPGYIPKLRKIMKGYDVIHTHNSSPQLFAVLANMGLRKKLVTTEHSTNNRKREHPAFSFIDKWMYRQYNKVVTISGIAEEKLYQYLSLQDNNILRSRISTINNGVDVNSFFKAQPIDELGHKGRFAVAMVAGFREAKDQDTLIKAVAKLPHDYELWLVGDGVRRSELESLVQTQNVG